MNTAHPLRHSHTDTSIAARQALMRCCALANDEELEAAVAALEPDLVITDMRKPEAGLIMLRGRIGGDGAPFNLGETTVTRAVVQLATGETGYGYQIGRSLRRARLAAIVDAAGQSGRFRARIEENLFRPVQDRVREQRRNADAETAATRVDFFTLVRGED